MDSFRSFYSLGCWLVCRRCLAVRMLFQDRMCISSVFLEGEGMTGSVRVSGGMRATAFSTRLLLML